MEKIFSFFFIFLSVGLSAQNTISISDMDKIRRISQMVDVTDESLFQNELEKTFFYQKNKKSVIDLKIDADSYAEYRLGKDREGKVVFISKKVISDEGSPGYLAKSYFNVKGRLIAYIEERKEIKGTVQYDIKSTVYFDENSIVLKMKDYYYLNGSISKTPDLVSRIGPISVYQLTLYDFFTKNVFKGIKNSDFTYSQLVESEGSGLGSGSGYGGGSGSGSDNRIGYSLGNRKALSKPQPKYTCNEQGKVAVQITVDKNGNIIEAVPGVKGTTNTASCLLQQAKIAAMNTKWQASADAPDRQVGKIIYNFSLN